MPAKKMTIEDLAKITLKGFDGVDRRFEQVDKRFEQVDKRFEGVETTLNHMNARMSNIEQDVADIRKNFVYRYEFEDLMARVKYLEKKLRVKSGK